METVKLAAAREIADKYSIKFEIEMASLELFQSNIASTKQDLSDNQLKLRRVSALIINYERIIEVNYIDNFIRAQR